MLHSASLSCSNFSDKCVSHFLKSNDAIRRDLLVEEYVGTGEDRVKNRNAHTEFLGDMLFTFPAIKTANAHRGTLSIIFLFIYLSPDPLEHHFPLYLTQVRGKYVFLILR